MKPIKYVYIATPYSDDDPAVVEQRFEDTERYTHHLLKQGITAVSPIVSCHALSKKYNLPGNFDFWQHYCVSLLYALAETGTWDGNFELHVLMLDGWKDSPGVNGEIYEVEPDVCLFIDKDTYEVDPSITVDNYKNV